MSDFFENGFNNGNNDVDIPKDEPQSSFVVKDEDSASGNGTSSFNGGYYNTPQQNIIQDEPINNNNQYYSNNPYGNYSFNDINFNNGNNGNYKAPKKKKKGKAVAIAIIACILSVAIIVSGILIVKPYIKSYTLNTPSKDISSLPQIEESEDSENGSDSSATSDDEINIDEDASNVAKAVATKCTKYVVGIRTTTSVISFFGGSSEETGEGSGVIYTSDGYIITNYHVIENAVVSTSGSKIEVFLDNAQTTPYTAKVVGYNISTDLAVLKIDATGLSAAELGNSSELKVGQYAITIGAPGGLEFMGSVTYGIISGLDRVVSSNTKIGLIQTDAAINPGNSGGALLNSKGKLIGINSSKIVSEEFEGMGFAIPINTVVEVCNNIISNKDKEEPYIGITVSDKYTAEVLKSYGYPSGAVVLSVAEGSAAEKCGIAKGDIITEFNGVEITEYDVFDKELAKCTPGTTVTIKIYRSGQTYQAKITIGSNNQ